MRSYTGVTEDAALGRAARPDGTALFRQALLNRRAAAFAALVAALAAYYAGSGSLWNASLWWDVAWLAVVLIPAVFAVVWFLLPVLRGRAGSGWSRSRSPC